MNPDEVIRSGALDSKPDVKLARSMSARRPRSDKWKLLIKTEMKWAVELGNFENWTNDVYNVNARRFAHGWPFGGGEYAELGISAIDGSARHDWREFQLIKNEICDLEWEAIELYPAESRLLDPSNYYILWCAPRIPVGKYEPRLVVGVEKCIAPQRGWRSGCEPKDVIK
jgi:hypothetical protein